LALLATVGSSGSTSITRPASPTLAAPASSSTDQRQRAHPDRKVVTSRLLPRSCSGSSMSSGIGFFTRHAGHQKTMVSPGTLRPIHLGRVAVTEMGLPQGGRIAPALTPCLDCDELIAGVAIRGAGGMYRPPELSPTSPPYPSQHPVTPEVLVQENLVVSETLLPRAPGTQVDRRSHDLT
jgi:hypothetical protein